MENYTNEKGETVVIAAMDDNRLIHTIAKYAVLGQEELVKALKGEALARLGEAKKIKLG